MAEEKLPPHNIEAEESLLGAILLDSNQMSRIDLETVDFFEENHQAIYHAMLNLYKLGGGIDQVTVAHEIMRLGKLEQVGGAGYLSHLISVVPTSLHAPYYAKVLRDCSLNRQLLDAAGQIAAIGYANGDPLEGLSKSQTTLSSISKLISRDELLTPQDIAGRADVRYEMLRDIQPGLSSGFAPLDNKIGGLSDGDYIILAGRPGIGKSTLALQIAENIAVNHNALFICLEMTADAITDKRISWVIGKSVSIVRRGNYGDDLFDDITFSVGKLAERNLYLSHGPATTHSLRRVMESMKLSYGLDIAFIDYLQLLRDRFGNNANERIGFISGELANMAKEFDIPLVVLSQLSRAPDGRMDRRPHLSDLRESGSIEQDADLIVFLYRDSYYDREVEPDGAETEVLIGKDRMRGLSGKLSLFWDAEGERYVSNKRRAKDARPTLGLS